ncbi:unnamed protein product [Boreogadus saida]
MASSQGEARGDTLIHGGLIAGSLCGRAEVPGADGSSGGGWRPSGGGGGGLRGTPGSLPVHCGGPPAHFLSTAGDPRLTSCPLRGTPGSLPVHCGSFCGLGLLFPQP